MPDATQNDATQADAGVQSQADTTSQTENTTPADVNDVQAETISLDEAKKLRSESASLRKRLKEAEAAVQKFEMQNQTEAEKREAALAAAEERASTAESRYRKAVGRAAVAEEASKSGAISPKAIHALIQDAIEFDDEGSPTNVAALVEKLRTEEPALFRTPSADGGKGAPATSQDMNALIRRAAGRK